MDLLNELRITKLGFWNAVHHMSFDRGNLPRHCRLCYFFSLLSEVASVGSSVESSIGSLFATMNRPIVLSSSLKRRNKPTDLVSTTNERVAPSHERFAPSHERVAPSHERFAPSHERVLPRKSSQDTNASSIFLPTEAFQAIATGVYNIDFIASPFAAAAELNPTFGRQFNALFSEHFGICAGLHQGTATQGVIDLIQEDERRIGILEGG
ncbi:hypothetical protein BDV95DRAFT_588860 [Massariosphaeria phaeospora]|uniref:Uncharacterized protein n=1 Tax=Massariosphaeria phaeospora TaxID=100035 RepID=A0A7C8MGD3_9PLEO|nr:hypothetical protein BDV95DRAFT_588860 [Massariosphaeria phaeospora]